MQNVGHHHLHLRKRAYKKLEPYPHPNVFTRFLDRVMVAIALVGPAATLPQVFDVFMAKDATGFSLTTWGIWTVLSVIWAFYGFVHREMPIFVANVIYILLDGLVVWAILMYR